ncbi:hypothetical protein G3N96_04670 [Burkholderia sp. Se-20373]|uniref:hypothetical protein n=1 Tax=Burkholderia sp. Se-20373 TaxID=2703898 RepID=UPI00197EBBF6|nr:hypothetical protein [Burkholderia sp. Se-20373]MBN3744728.1 hypothetical protein [Burkholderia sp. Se-20373]
MVSSVAGQGPNPGGATSAPSFFSQKPIATLVGGALHVNKAALSARAQAAPGVASDDDGLFLRLIAAIRRFFARLCRVILPSKFFASSVEDNSRPDGLSTSAQGGPFPTISETEEELVIDGLPESSLDRVRQTIDEMVNVAVGDTLPNSLKTALAMPELGRRQAFRVFLQQNFGDTRQMREVRAELRRQIEEMIEPFASEHGIDKETALTLFRADLESGGGVIAERVDPNSEIRGHVAELKRLETALAALAKARGMICARAIEAGVYTREELGAVVAAQGLDTEFLFKAEAVAAQPAEAMPERDSSTAPAPANVVSMADYRQSTGAPVPVDYTPAEGVPLSPAVAAAVDMLVEQGVIEPVQAQEIAQSAVVDAALSDESEFEFEADTNGDDLGDFFKKDSASKPVPKL